MEKEIKRGFKKATPTERIVFNDEEQKRYVLLLFHCKTSFSNLQFQYIQYSFCWNSLILWLSHLIIHVAVLNNRVVLSTHPLNFRPSGLNELKTIKGQKLTPAGGGGGG